VSSARTRRGVRRALLLVCLLALLPAAELGISLTEGLIGLFLYGALYAFFGAFARAWAQADAARRESQGLLEQLREAMARLGLVVSTQPLFIESEKSWLHKRLGPARARQTYPFSSLVEAGVRVAGASDAPVESTDVLHAVQCCVTREGFEVEQGISAAQALRIFTIDAAYAQFEEDEKGSIRPGKRADFAVLSANPVSVPAEAIREIRVEQTIVAGCAVYTRGG